VTAPAITREWLLRRVVVSESTGCWLWRRKVSDRGYPYTTLSDNKRRRVNRLAYAMQHGEIPDGLSVCHSCDRHYAPSDSTYRRCVNPEHLFVGTHAENMADMAQKNRSGRMHGEANHQAKLTEAHVRLMLWLRSGHGARLQDLADWFDVSKTMTGFISRGEKWAHVPRVLSSASPANTNTQHPAAQEPVAV
jgi:hypothetical protein